MIHVPSRDVSERPHGEGVPAGDAAPEPRLIRHVAEKRQCGGADGPELIDVRGQRARVGAARRNGDVLIVAGQRRVEFAGKPESAVREYALGVVDVRRNFPNAPFAGLLAEELLLFGHNIQ